jgi:hypothetical protein
MQVPHALPDATFEAAESIIAGDKSPSGLRSYHGER